jgi:hypothetical protein
MGECLQKRAQQDDMEREEYSMTKVFMNRGLLAYRLYMKDSLQQVIQRNFVNGAPQPYVADPPFTQEHLLAAPSIGFFALDGYFGQGDDVIGFIASHDLAFIPCTSRSWMTRAA